MSLSFSKKFFCLFLWWKWNSMHFVYIICIRWRINMEMRYHAWHGHCQLNICSLMCLHPHHFNRFIHLRRVKQRTCFLLRIVTLTVNCKISMRSVRTFQNGSLMNFLRQFPIFIFCSIYTLWICCRWNRLWAHC